MAAPVLSGEREDIQGLLASGYGHLPHAAYLLFTIDDAPAAAGWLAQLADTVTTARARQARRSFNAALSATALVKLGLSEAARGGFPLEFTGGMVDDAHRRRILGDVGVNAPELWAWGCSPSCPGVFWRPDSVPALRSRGRKWFFSFSWFVKQCERGQPYISPVRRVGRGFGRGP